MTQKNRKEELGFVYTYPDIFESATFFPDTASVHTYPVNPEYESATFWIRYPEKKIFEFAMKRESWRRYTRIFFLSRDITFNIEPNSLPRILYSRWQLRRMLCCQYSQRSPRYKSESVYVSDSCQIRVDGQIRFESGKENLRIQKYPDIAGFQYHAIQNRWK